MMGRKQFARGTLDDIEGKTGILGIVASDDLLGSSDSAGGSNGTAPVKQKEARIMATGTYRIKFSLKDSVASDGKRARGRIYKDGVGYGTIMEADDDTLYDEFTEDLTFIEGELCQLYIWVSATVQVVTCKNFRIYGELSTTAAVVIIT